MKRLFPLFALLLVLLTSACRPRAPQQARATDFSCRFSATLDGMALEGTVNRYTAGTLELTFTQPQTLDGVTAVWDGQRVTLKLHGLTFDLDPADIPEQAVGSELVAVLDQVLREEVKSRAQDGNTVYDGTVGGADYTLTCDGESGLPQSLSIPALKLSMTFEEES